MDYDRLRELQEKFEENPRRYFAPLANEYRKGGQPKRAIEICRAQLAQMPGHMSGQIVFGQALYEAGEFDEARQVFERALTLDPENLIALRTLGDMSLQSGDTVQARKWYTRLLDADPKDSAVVTLVAEIDASADAVTPAPEVIPGVDTDAGDQLIPFIADAQGNAIDAEASPESSQDAPEVSATPASARDHAHPEASASHSESTKAAERAQPAVQEPTAPEGPTVIPTSHAPPHAAEEPQAEASHTRVEGLEHHYPVESQTAEEPAREEVAESDELSAEDLGVGLGTEGLTSSLPIPHTGLTGSHARVQTPEAVEGLQGTAPESEPVGTEGLKGKPVPAPLEGARGSRSDDEDALDTWTPPPGADVHERAGPGNAERTFSGTSAEPFVNETMAQLYLQQGYRQLALKVYYQLSASRPNDQALKDKISEIEEADRAAHPEAAAAPPAPARAAEPSRAPEPSRSPEPSRAPQPVAPRAPEPVASRTPAPVVARSPEPFERPAPAEPARSPSIEAPTPSRGAESEEAPLYDRSPVDSPPSAPPSRQRESVESPVREEPQAEPEAIAARQPSIKEFFATLGRRRPPRAAPPATSRSGGSVNYGGSASAQTEPTNADAPPMTAAPTNPADAAAVMGGAVPGASLDAVFAGAQVNPADSRAASRLAGAFSGTPGARTTPPTPPMPTPRVNPRLPQTQESEEDVAKFRAWLDGLTGE